MISRREFLKMSAAVGGGALIATRLSVIQRAFAEYVANNTLEPASITKYEAPMVIPPAMPKSAVKGGKHDFYNIAVRQFPQQILPASQFERTTVWSYGNVDFPATFNYPAFTIEAPWNRQVKVKWINDLVDPVTGSYLPHLLPVDPTLHWANPAGGQNGRDMRPSPKDKNYWAQPALAGTNGSYIGPVPIVTHVHGAHTIEDSDGYPEAWYLPAALNIPKGFATTGTWYDKFLKKYKLNWAPGTAEFTYPNTQRPTTLWYHDHTLGMTRLNVYAGPAGFWLIRDAATNDGVIGTLPGPAPSQTSSPTDPTGLYEIPIVIQDRSFADPIFTQSGLPDLWYPNYRAFFEGLGDVPDFLQIPFTPNLTLGGGYSDVAPIWQPEFFGNVMVVNGVSWPYLQVEQQQYRFRLLNGCNSRFLILDFSYIPGVKVWQIGADGGFLPAPVEITSNQILLGLAERADVIVDFRGVPTGDWKLLNRGPDEPFGGPDSPEADPETTGQVMQFRVGSGSALGFGAFTEPYDLILPTITPLTPTAGLPWRQLSLNEEMSATVFVPFDAGADEFVLDTAVTLWEVPAGAAPTLNPDTGLYEYAGLPGVTWNRLWAADAFGPTAALLGTVDPLTGAGIPALWMAPVTENPAVGTTEVWEIHNLTVDAHPIHIHLVQFQVVGREPIGGGTSVAGRNEPLPGEEGFKDTVIAYPGEITRVKALFDTPGRFVWHCHIVEHEDNEMMRPYDVV